MSLNSIARFSHVAHSRTPMIKFLGARLPRPNFDSSKFPLIGSSSGGPSQTSASSKQPGHSFGKVGTTPRGSGIDETQLPLRFRRPFLDEVEIDAINSGGATAYKSAM